MVGLGKEIGTLLTKGLWGEGLLVPVVAKFPHDFLVMEWEELGDDTFVLTLWNWNKHLNNDYPITSIA